MAKLLGIKSTGSSGCGARSAGDFYSPALDRPSMMDSIKAGNIQEGAIAGATALVASPLSLAIRVGAGYVVGRELGIPWMAAIGSGLFGMLGLLGAVLIGANSKSTVKANGRRRKHRRSR